MFDFNFIIKVIISAILLYLVVNSIFKFHVYNDLISAALIFSILLVMIFYSDIAYNHIFSIIISSLVLVYMVVTGVLYKKRIRYYWLLNINYKNYHKINYYLLTIEENNVKYTYNKKFPFLIKFYDSNYKAVKSLLKGLEAQEKKRKKSFTFCNYWQIIIFLTMMVILWRF